MSHHLSLASGPSFNPPASIGLVRAGPRIRTVASLVSGRGQDARRGRGAVVTVLRLVQSAQGTCINWLSGKVDAQPHFRPCVSQGRGSGEKSVWG